jgi:hypothetical protein
MEQQPETAPETAYDFTHNTEEAETTDAHIAFPGSPEDEDAAAKRHWQLAEENAQIKETLEKGERENLR